jgi:sulfide:quinone oxidoreductase
MSELHHDPVRVVIAGGGVAALEALVALRSLAPDRVTPLLVAASETYVDRPLSVGEPFGLGAPRPFGLRELAASVGAEVCLDRVCAVDADAHTLSLGSGDQLAYDVLLLALGARRTPAFDCVTTFDRETAPEDFDDVLADLDDGLAPRVAIVVPDGVDWTLPAYELALLTAARGQAGHPGATSVTLLTHEAVPVQAFGAVASRAVDDVLTRGRVIARCGVHVDVVSATALRAGGGWSTFDRIVSLPVPAGRAVPGVPADRWGFLPVDAFGRVDGLDDVYAAGDGTVGSPKQGGLAAQQAAVAAAHIAALAGADVRPQPLRTVLRAVLGTSDGPLYLRAEHADVPGTSAASSEPLWWPPTKSASRWLAPHLARLEADRRLGWVGAPTA